MQRHEIYRVDQIYNGNMDSLNNMPLRALSVGKINLREYFGDWRVEFLDPPPRC